MLIQIWARLRGYQTWTPATATVHSSTVAGIGIGGSAEDTPKKDKVVVGWESSCRIAWADQHGAEHTGTFEAYEESPLYQLCDGDTVEIRFNPNRPDEFYVPGLLEARLTGAWKFGLFAVMMVLACAVIAMIWLGPNVLFRTSPTEDVSHCTG